MTYFTYIIRLLICTIRTLFCTIRCYEVEKKLHKVAHNGATPQKARTIGELALLLTTLALSLLHTEVPSTGNRPSMADGRAPVSARGGMRPWGTSGAFCFFNMFCFSTC